VIIVSIVVLMLSTIGGWACVAFMSRNSNKSKKRANALMTVGALAIYYFLFVKITGIFEEVTDNVGKLGEKVQSSNHLIYLIGQAFSGNIGLLMIVWIVVIACALLLFFVFEKKYLGYITKQNARVVKAFDAGQIKTKSQANTLVYKDIKRYLSCATYILNCSFGTVFMMVLSVLMLFKGNDIFKLIEMMIDSNINFVPILNISLICIMISLNTITAPSISLEGKNLWILKSLPVREWTIIKTKIKLHYFITIVPVLIFDAELLVIARQNLFVSAMTLLITMLYPLFTAGLGLFINLMKPKLNWTSESTVTRLNVGSITTMVIGGGIPLIIMIESIKMMDLYRVENSTKPLMVSYFIIEVLAVAGMMLLLKTVGVKKLRKIY
jgi:ABC-2 type transport system permease protein